jgi:CheY-like chemotaxis protein
MFRLSSSGRRQNVKISKRILVVDDEPVLRTLTARALRECGYEVVEAADGLIGYELARAQTFDLVVTDSRMPNMNGTELVTRLRLLNPSLPILHVSGSNGETSAGTMPTDVPTLDKPFHICDLVKKAEELFAQASENDAAE